MVRKVAKMNKCGYHIIFIFEGGHIILKGFGVYHNTVTGHHGNNRGSKTVKIHVNEWLYRFIGSGIRPIACKFPSFHNTYYRLGIIDLVIGEQVAVIPAFYGSIVDIIAFAQALNLIVGKTDIWCEAAGIEHGIFLKIIECGLGL